MSVFAGAERLTPEKAPKAAPVKTEEPKEAEPKKAPKTLKRKAK